MIRLLAGAAAVLLGLWVVLSLLLLNIQFNEILRHVEASACVVGKEKP